MEWDEKDFFWEKELYRYMYFSTSCFCLISYHSSILPILDFATTGRVKCYGLAIVNVYEV